MYSTYIFQLFVITRLPTENYFLYNYIVYFSNNITIIKDSKFIKDEYTPKDKFSFHKILVFQFFLNIIILLYYLGISSIDL